MEITDRPCPKWAHVARVSVAQNDRRVSRHPGKTWECRQNIARQANAATRVAQPDGSGTAAALI